ncbi:MAG: halocyanin domain-containing protein [Halobacteriota archaeon]
MNRRAVLRKSFLAAVAVGTGCLGGDTSTGGDSGGPYGGWFDGVDDFEGTLDQRSHDRVEVRVGADGSTGPYRFNPMAVTIAVGATVRWVWTGAGGQHNVIDEDGTFASDYSSAEGFTFDHQFGSAGTYHYTCKPHIQLGMKGVVRVVDEP